MSQLRRANALTRHLADEWELVVTVGVRPAPHVAVRLAVIARRAVLARHQAVGLSDVAGHVGAPMPVVAAGGRRRDIVDPGKPGPSHGPQTHPVHLVVQGEEHALSNVVVLHLLLFRNVGKARQVATVLLAVLLSCREVGGHGVEQVAGAGGLIGIDDLGPGRCRREHQAGTISASAPAVVKLANRKMQAQQLDAR